jgi:hypothetical protein
MFSPAPDGRMRAKEARHTERTAGKYRIVDSTKNAGGYSAVAAFDRLALAIGDGPMGFTPAAHNADLSPESDARLEWYFHTPAIHLGVMKIEKKK